MLYSDPVLVIDPGMHTGQIFCADADASGQWGVTGSDDKTVRVWSLRDGALQRTIRLPAGPGEIGKVYAIAMSPDGATIAAGGWTRRTDEDPQQQIYFFDRATGALLRRIDGLPSYTNCLAFSADGNRVAAALSSNRGLRIYGRENNWTELGSDTQYGGPSFGAAFAPEGRLATTAVDGKVRIYANECAGALLPASTIDLPRGSRLYGVAFSPDGTRLAVGYAEITSVVLLDSHTLKQMPGPELDGLTASGLSTVAWSRDGKSLYGAGNNGPDGTGLVVVWPDSGTGPRRTLPAGRDTVNAVVPLPGNELLVAGADPWLALVSADGNSRWEHGPAGADFRDQFDKLSVSNDGIKIGFGFAQFGKEPARFDLAARTLTLDPPADAAMLSAQQTGLPVVNWYNTNGPALAGHRLPLEPREYSRSLAIHSSGDRFVLGSEWWLRAFDATGTLLWATRSPGIVWALTIAGSGKLIVAACGDGTIRWYRMDDGVELLAFMPLADQSNWVAWTPVEGFYAATPGARGVLRWHVNRGWDEPADSVAIADIKGSFRPVLLPLVLEELETRRALGRAGLIEHSLQIAIRTNSRLPKDARLVVLSIGISAYNQDHAGNLRLKFAANDADEFGNALVDTQDALYARVSPLWLLNEKATRDAIITALETMQKLMVRGRDDLAIVLFSGHGAIVDGRFYLLPWDVDARDNSGIRKTALWIEDLKGDLLRLADLGRVLVLLDACHSGATTMDGQTVALNATQLRLALAEGNVMVLTSSSESEVSVEREEWRHGAFTKALLDALTGADDDSDGLIDSSDLSKFVDHRVRYLTSDAQTPGVVFRYNTTLLAARL